MSNEIEAPNAGKGKLSGTDRQLMRAPSKRRKVKRRIPREQERPPVHLGELRYRLTCTLAAIQDYEELERLYRENVSATVLQGRHDAMVRFLDRVLPPSSSFDSNPEQNYHQNCRTLATLTAVEAVLRQAREKGIGLNEMLADSRTVSLVAELCTTDEHTVQLALSEHIPSHWGTKGLVDGPRWAAAGIVASCNRIGPSDYALAAAVGARGPTSGRRVLDHCEAQDDLTKSEATKAGLAAMVRTGICTPEYAAEALMATLLARFNRAEEEYERLVNDARTPHDQLFEAKTRLMTALQALKLAGTDTFTPTDVGAEGCWNPESTSPPSVPHKHDPHVAKE